MRLVIHSRKLHADFEFFTPLGDYVDGDAYVYLEGPGRPGTLGQQITYPGGMAVMATRKNFERVCRSWYRRHVARVEA